MADEPRPPDAPKNQWMRAIRWHTYLGRPQEIGDVYYCQGEMVETIEAVLKYAVRDEPPPDARR